MRAVSHRGTTVLTIMISKSGQMFSCNTSKRPTMATKAGMKNNAIWRSKTALTRRKPVGTAPRLSKMITRSTIAKTGAGTAKLALILSHSLSAKIAAKSKIPATKLHISST